MSDDEYDAAFREVMGREIEGTPLHNLDLYLIGEALLNAVGTSVMLGHTSPAHTLDYIPAPVTDDHVSKHIVQDLLAWVGRRQALRPGCSTRLPAWVRDEWLPRQMGKAYDRLMEPNEDVA